ncbi:MAG: hypothetical protein M8867_06645 [marine benthic group bacterium]|nr:hypothetical protein [Gemmatimonadota bacterium]
MLALLGSGSGRGLTRDKLVGLLWPDQPQEAARHSLSDVVYRARKLVGEKSVRSEAEFLSLDRAVVRSDVLEFSEAIAQGDLSRAIELYRGPFLDGFHLPGAPREFEVWLDHERSRLASEYEKAVEALAESAEADSDPVRAAEMWRRLMRQDPTNSRVALRLMRTLAGAGDVGNAISFAEEHERFLREELDLDLPAPVREYVGALREGTAPESSAVTPSTARSAVARGSAGVLPSGTANAPRPIGAGVGARRSRRGWRLAVPLILLLALAYAGLGVLRRSSLAGGAIPEIRSIAVLPLHDLSDSGGEPYLADGLTAELIGELGQLNALEKVISRRTAMQYHDDDRSLSEIASELEVDAILEGTVFRAAEEVRITLQLVHGPTDRVVWSRAYEGRESDLIPLQKRVSRDVADGVQLTLTPEEAEQLVRAGPATDPQAYEAYLKGKYHVFRWGDADALAARGHYERAIELDPEYAAAHAAIAELCIMALPINIDTSWTLDDCEAMARRALVIDPELAEAHAVLGLIHNTRWDWPAAEAEYRRAIELNSNAVEPRIWYALFLSQMLRLDEAVAEGLRAEELDPLNGFAKSITAGALMNAHRYDEALQKLDEALGLDPDHGGAYIYVAAIRNLQGRPEEALEAARRAARRTGADAGQILVLQAWSHALLGDGERALQVMDQALELRGPIATASGYAIVLQVLGRVDEALEMLEMAYQARAPWLPNVTSYPHYDALREHPRFRAIRQGMGL